jgi:uncharacterized protein with von Willebrand factor type A (vWA) domain
MLDSSGSMDGDLPDGGKWAEVKSAVAAFLKALYSNDGYR